MVFAMWETLFIIITTPWRLVAQTAASMAAPLEENGIGATEEVPLQPATLQSHPDFLQLRQEVQRLHKELLGAETPLTTRQSSSPVSHRGGNDTPPPPCDEVPPPTAPAPMNAGPLVPPTLNLHVPMGRLFPDEH